jgi:uncharacterized protein
MLIGVISDTHGLLRPEAVAALRGSDHILHAGDVGDVQILEELQKLAPITAIRGNIDRSGHSFPPWRWWSLAARAFTWCTTSMN